MADLVAGFEVGREIRDPGIRAAKALEQFADGIGLPSRREKIGPELVALSDCLPADEARFLRAFIGARLVVRMRNGRRMQLVAARARVSVTELERAKK